MNQTSLKTSCNKEKRSSRQQISMQKSLGVKTEYWLYISRPHFNMVKKNYWGAFLFCRVTKSFPNDRGSHTEFNYHESMVAKYVRGDI